MFTATAPPLPLVLSHIAHEVLPNLHEGACGYGEQPRTQADLHSGLLRGHGWSIKTEMAVVSTSLVASCSRVALSWRDFDDRDSLVFCISTSLRLDMVLVINDMSAMPCE